MDKLKNSDNYHITLIVAAHIIMEAASTNGSDIMSICGRYYVCAPLFVHSLNMVLLAAGSAIQAVSLVTGLLISIT